jgi:hypothetical protein
MYISKSPELKAILIERVYWNIMNTKIHSDIYFGFLAEMRVPISWWHMQNLIRSALEEIENGK